jgi:hypothetical protein
MLDWMRLLNISVHWTFYWGLLFIIPPTVAGMHILCSKDIWTTFQIRVICLKNCQCWFSMILCLVIRPYIKKLPTSGFSPSHFLITYDWIDLVLFCHRFFLSFRIVLTVECDILGCKLSLLFLTLIYSKLCASLQSHCFSFLPTPHLSFFFFIIIIIIIYSLQKLLFQFWLKVDVSHVYVCFYNHLNKQCF